MQAQLRSCFQGQAWLPSPSSSVIYSKFSCSAIIFAGFGFLRGNGTQILIPE